MKSVYLFALSRLIISVNDTLYSTNTQIAILTVVSGNNLKECLHFECIFNRVFPLINKVGNIGILVQLLIGIYKLRTVEYQISFE